LRRMFVVEYASPKRATHLNSYTDMRMAQRINYRSRNVVMALVLCLSFATPALFAQDEARGEGTINPAEPTGITVQDIIQRFAAKEKEFAIARQQYTWRQDVRVQTLDGNTVDGEYRQVVDILFDDKGRRTQNVVFAPQSTLQRVGMTKEDIDDIEKRLPFVLTSDDIGDYDILYVGQQKQDELNTYVFDVAPKRIEKDRRYFQGRLWVDDHDFQIVKTFGKNVPDMIGGKPVSEVDAKKRAKRGGNENLFPKFTTWREQIDGKYWFPTYTRVDDDLEFASGPVHIRQIVKYMNYKRFGSDVKITYEGEEIPDQKTEKK
jgi:hypothetical protein